MLHKLLTSAVVRGWNQAQVILCLGSHELLWMRKHFPSLKPRLGYYFDAPPPADQEQFAAIRSKRALRSKTGVRYLWIGRWAAHKGTDLLLRWIIERAASSDEDSFTLAGTGSVDLHEGLTGLVEAGRLRIIPSFPRPQIYELLANHDAGALHEHRRRLGALLERDAGVEECRFLPPQRGV